MVNTAASRRERERRRGLKNGQATAPPPRLRANSLQVASWVIPRPLPLEDKGNWSSNQAGQLKTDSRSYFHLTLMILLPL